MKNHIKVKEFCEKEVNADEVLENFLINQEIRVVNEIHTISSNNDTLLNLMKRLGGEYAIGNPKKAICALEIMYKTLKSEYEFIIRNKLNLKLKSQSFGEGDNILSIENLFDEAFDSMYQAAKLHKNVVLLRYLHVYRGHECIRDHKEAKKLYEETDPEKDFLDMIMDRIKNVPIKYTLEELIDDYAKTFAHNESKEAISILEAVYEILDQKKELIQGLDNKDTLFEGALFNMRETAALHHNADLLRDLDKYYPEEQVPAIGISEIS